MKKNSKFKDLMNEIFSTKKTKIAFFTCVLSCLLLIGVTFAWFYSIIELPQSEIKTGTIDYVVKGYDNEGNFISTIVNPDDVTADLVNPNHPLFNLKDICANKYTTAYISIENVGSLDMEYAFSLKVSGNPEDEKNIGGFWFKIEEITSIDYKAALDANKASMGEEPYNAQLFNYSTQLKDYVDNATEVVMCSEECIQNGSNLCTEHSTLSRNLITANSYAVYGKLDAKKEVAFYRIDIGLKATSTPERYANTSLRIAGEVYGSQIGGINGETGYGNIYKVSDAQSLDRAIENALPGDSIQLIAPIVYRGDLVFNKSISLITYGNDLTIYGNLVYDFVASYTLKLNLTHGGQIKVLKENGAGGDLQINTPNSTVLVTGKNYTSNIYVEDLATFKVTNSDTSAGLFISGANFLSYEGNPKNVLIDSNSKVTLDYGAAFGLVEAVPNATNIKIINYGTIETINLSKMLLIDLHPEEGNLVDTGAPQILIDNYARIIDPIQPPTWSRPYVLEPNANGEHEGNTLIYRQIGADEMSVLEDISAFKTSHIIDYNKRGACVVQKVSGKNDKLIVYYGNRLDENNEVIYLTLEDLLVEYFVEFYNYAITEEEARTYIDLVNHIEVYSLTDVEFDDDTLKQLTNDDLAYMNGMDRLNSIDISKASVVNNTMPASAFKDNKVLTSFVLPNNIERLEGNVFNGSGLIQIRIPSSVNYYAYSSIKTIKYIFYDSPTVVLPTSPTWNELSKHYVFCNEAVLSEYITGFKGYFGGTRIFVDGELTDDKLHVVRDGMEGYELIVYTGSGGELKIGSELSLNGESISITSIKRYAYSSVAEPFNAELDSTITQIEDYAFYNSKIENVKLNNVRTIGKYAFYKTLLYTIDFGNVHTIGEYAFSECEYLTDIDTNKVEIVNNYAFYVCKNIYKIKFPNATFVGSHVLTGCSRLLEVSFYKVNELKLFSQNVPIVNLYFYNESFDNVKFEKYAGSTTHPNFRVFVTGSELADFNKLSFITSSIVYPIGDKVGHKNISITTTFGVEYSIDIGEYIVSKDVDNVTLITCNKTLIDENYTVPGKVTIEYENGSTVEKTVVKVGSYCYRRTKFETITLTFAHSITTVATWAFYGHANAYYGVNDFRKPIETVDYYNHIYEINFNNVKYIGNYSFYFFKNITKIDKNNVIEEIGCGAFKNCENLFTVDLPCIRILGVEGETYNNIFGYDTELVSVKLGPNLEKIYGAYFIDYTQKKFRELIIEAEITKDDYIDSLFYNNYYANYNKDFRIFVPESVISQQRDLYLAQLRIIGKKYGNRIVTHGNLDLTFDIGEYTYRETAVDGTAGVEITSYNYYEALGTFELPETINDINVIKLGHNCFRNVSFTSVPAIDSTGDQVQFGSELLEIGDNVFYSCNIRFSNLSNILYLGNNSIYNCTNIYKIEGLSLLKAGNSVLRGCTNIKIVNTPSLHTVGTYFLYQTNPIALFTNIQVSGDNTWLTYNSIRYLTYATTENSELVLLKDAVPNNKGRAALTNSKEATKYVKYNVAYGIFSQDDFKCVNEYTFEILDDNQNVIYTHQLYEYLINKEGENVTIYRSLKLSYDEDYMVPSVLDGRTVTSIAERAYLGVNFNLHEVSFGDTIKSIGVAAFQSCKIGGTLNLNNVTSISSATFEYNNYEVVYAPNLTSWQVNCFGNTDTLISVYLHKISGYSNSPFAYSDNLKFYYTETMPNFGVPHAFYIKNGMTFVLNIEVDDASDIKTTNWDVFSDITIYVPYESLGIYESVFETDTYNNFKVEPYGYVITEEDTGNVFILEETNGNKVYNEETGEYEYEKVFKLMTCLSTNETVKVPDSYEGINVTLIDERAFKGQIAIKNIILPTYLYSYDENTFQNVTNLASLEIDNDNSVHFSTHNGVLYTKGYTDLVHYPKCKQDQSYSIQEDTKVIRSNAFKNALVLKSLTFSSNIEVIGENAFINSSINVFIFSSTTPPVVTGHNIFDKNESSLIIYVPKGYIEEYRKVNAFAYMNLVEL